VGSFALSSDQRLRESLKRLRLNISIFSASRFDARTPIEEISVSTISFGRQVSLCGLLELSSWHLMKSLAVAERTICHAMSRIRPIIAGQPRIRK